MSFELANKIIQKEELPPKVEEEDETTVPVEERPPAPYLEGADVTVNELLDQPPELQSTEEQEESLSGEQWFGYALGTTVELTAPIAGNVAYIKWLNRAKTAAKVAKPVRSTVPGMLALGVGEITLGALSNYANQKIKEAYKIQKGVRISEIMAAGVFNATPVVKIVDGLPVFKFLQPPLGKSITPKMVTINGVKTFVSGATIGILESSFRQSVSMLLQEERRDADGNLISGFDYTDLTFSAAVGGTLNTALQGGMGLFSFYRTKGKAGRAEAVRVTEVMDANIVKQIDDINKQIQKETDDVGIFTNFKEKNAKIAELKNQRKQAEEARELNKQLKQEIVEENARVDDLEANPKPIEEEKVLTEEELEAPDETLREVVDEETTVTPVEKEIEEPTVVKEEAVEVEEVKAEEPEAPKPKVLKRSDELQSLVDRTKAAFGTGQPPTIEGPNLVRDAKKLYRDSSIIFARAIHTFRESDNKDIRALEIALDEVVFIRQLNQKVVDPLDTLMGRGLQSSRQDADKYNYQSVLSERAGAESDAWFDVEKSLRQAIENEADVDLFKNIETALDVRAKFKKLGKQLRKDKEDDEIQEAFTEPKLEEDDDIQEFLEDFDLEEEVDVTVPEEEVDVKAVLKARKSTKKRKKRKPAERLSAAEKAEKALQKRKKKLQERLKELQGRFGDPSKLTKEQKKQLQEDPEIADLKQRIKFYDASEKDFIEVKRLEAELAKVSELDVAPLGEQRAAVTPKPKAPTKPTTKATELKAKISKVKANIKQRLADIDKARREMDEEFSPEKAEQAFQKKITTLQTELDELRATFGKEPEELVPTAPKEKDPRVKDLEDKIKFYKDAQSEIRRIKELEAERARLLEIETGPLGRQRAEVEAKPTGPKKAPGRVQELTKDIADLRKNMRSRIREIDRARVEASDEFREAKVLESIRKRRALAQKRLDERRQRLGDDEDLDRRAAERAGRNIEESDPVLLETNKKIKFYDELEAEALKKKQLTEELARRIEIEARGVVSEMREQVAPKPKGPQKIRSTDKIRQEIRDADKRMRDKLKDIDAAEDSFRVERIYEAVRNQAVKAAQRDVETKLSRFMREWGNHRVYAMIWQTSSVLASALGGIASSFKQLVKLGAEPIADLMTTRNYRGTQIKALQLLKANAHGLAEGFRNWKGTGRAVARTAKNLQGATGGEGLNRLTGDVSLGDPIRLLEAAEAQAKRKRLRGEDVKGVQHLLARLPIHTIFSEILKLPLRGIMSVDQLFKRQLLRAELMSESWKDAFDAIPDDPEKAAELAAELYRQKWTRDQGIEVLSQDGVNSTATDTINKELLFDSNVANLDPSEIARPISDKILDFVKEIRQLKDNPAMGALIHLLAPILTVVARGAGRSIRVGVPIIPAGQAIRNPYNAKIKTVRNQIRDKDNYIAHEETTPQRRQELQKEKEELEQKVRELKGRRIAYHRDAITDTLLGSGMMALGYGMGAAGVAIGTTAWMTPEQRRKFQHKNPKAKENTIQGWGYREFFPLSIAFAIGADWAMYDTMKEFTDENGKPILTKEQSRLNLVIRSITELFKEVPIAGGIKAIERIQSGDDDNINAVLADWLGSFGLVPSQVNKVLKLYFEKGSIEELKGGSFSDRAAYRAVGNNPTGNKKTDHFGYDLPSPKTWLNTFIRWAPERSDALNAFDEIYKKDIEGDGQLVKPPSQFPTISGINMYDFVDNNGVSLHYRFNLELRKLKIDKDILETVKDRDWRKKWKEGSEERKGTADELSVSNPALVTLNKKLNRAYNKTAKSMLKDKALLNEFISDEENEEGTVAYDRYGPYKTLRQVIEQAKDSSVRTGEPISFEEILMKKDLDELIEANP